MKSCPTCQTSYPNNFQVCPQDGSALLEVGAWTEGSVIRGKYRIISKVGQGGMGAVYKVVHVAFDEVHALKVINPSLMSDDTFVKRFKHEAVITRKLQHVNAVRVDDIDEAEDGRPIIVMEYIEGQSLKKLIQEQGALPWPRVCAIIKQSAAALEAAHALGMVHRDIKPDNIVLINTPDGEVAKVLDFGIAKLKEAHANDSGGLTLTGTGVVIGTPQYMSPEQAMGKRGDDLDGRSDLYSLGVVMYQMLSGDLPFKAETTMAMLICHMQTTPIAIKAAHPDLQIPEPIADVVMKTLEKDPNHRPHDARAFINEIEAAENWAPPLGETRVFDPAQNYSPQDSSRRLREALKSPTPRPGAVRRPAPPPAEEVYEAPIEPVVPEPPPEPQPRLVTKQRPAPAKVQPAPPPRPVMVSSPPRKSSAALWAVVGVLGMLLILGGVFVYLKTANPVNPNIDQNKNLTDTNKNDTNKNDATKNERKDGSEGVQDGSQKTAKDDQNQGGQQDAQRDTGKVGRGLADANDGRNVKRGNSTATDRTAREQKDNRRDNITRENTKLPIDQTKIAAAIKLGDFLLSRGEYDNAITEYRKGLSLDPSNATLSDRVVRAQKAKASEGRILQ
jgi:serine/threonine-protein kinase